MVASLHQLGHLVKVLLFVGLAASAVAEPTNVQPLQHSAAVQHALAASVRPHAQVEGFPASSHACASSVDQTFHSGQFQPLADHVAAAAYAEIAGCVVAVAVAGAAAAADAAAAIALGPETFASGQLAAVVQHDAWIAQELALALIDCASAAAAVADDA